MNKDKWSVEITADGSPTLYSQKFDAHFHSLHGARQESQHVFVKEGLNYFLRVNPSSSVEILEFGMGTGLNVLLTYNYAQKHKIRINYTTLEAYPLDSEILNELDFGVDKTQQILTEIHNLPWNQECEISSLFRLTKIMTLFENYQSGKRYDIIYFDAFAPSCQPHLWEKEMLTIVFNSLKKGGIIVTFSVKGSFRRTLDEIGFQVEKIPGPPGKREMTRATKK